MVSGGCCWLPPRSPPQMRLCRVPAGPSGRDRPGPAATPPQGDPPPPPPAPGDGALFSRQMPGSYLFIWRGFLPPAESLPQMSRRREAGSGRLRGALGPRPHPARAPSPPVCLRRLLTGQRRALRCARRTAVRPGFPACGPDLPRQEDPSRGAGPASPSRAPNASRCGFRGSRRRWRGDLSRHEREAPGGRGSDGATGLQGWGGLPSRPPPVELPGQHLQWGRLASVFKPPGLSRRRDTRQRSKHQPRGEWGVEVRGWAELSSGWRNFPGEDASSGKGPPHGEPETRRRGCTRGARSRDQSPRAGCGGGPALRFGSHSAGSGRECALYGGPWVGGTSRAKERSVECSEGTHGGGLWGVGGPEEGRFRGKGRRQGLSVLRGEQAGRPGRLLAAGGWMTNVGCGRQRPGS